MTALRSSVVPHEQTNATTEALVDALYSCRLTVATLLFVIFCFSRITLSEATYGWKRKIVIEVRPLIARLIERSLL
jgi:hypothetical protein